MSVVVVGINHRTVPLASLEPMIVAQADLPKALADLAARPHLDESVLLSTCMRTEVYALVNRFHGAMGDVREFLSAWSGEPPEEFSGNLYSYFDEAALSHLFRVAAGLDSAALGEPEILGQVRQAWEVARREGACGPVLSSVFRGALQTGKRARAETAISQGTTSLAYAAMQLAESALGGLEGKQALVIGAGEVGEAAAHAFAGVAGTMQVMVTNRNPHRAIDVAAAVGGVAVPWEERSSALARADVATSCAGVPGTLLSRADVEATLAGRHGRPLCLVDLAVPRDIEPATRDLPAVTLLDMDDIGAFVAARRDERRAEVPAVERIVAEEVDHYLTWAAARSVAPLVTLLRDRAEKLRRAELTRLRGRLAVDAGTAEELEVFARRLVAKLLHEPTVKLKAAAGTPQGEALAQAFRELFDLD